ncbi:MAG: alanyl-tRNA editing protein [Lachnospiraceae bacterium]|nr:alanyl-tRNA editing protein [Lachnospiraceae bacterium]
MTRKLYHENSYLKEFNALVVNCSINEKGIFVELDQTAFFPEGGGQYADKGLLFVENDNNGIDVLDVQIDKAGTILHKVSREIAAGVLVHGVLDWERRFDFMQQHSGEHIFSGIANKLYGANNVGFHLGEEETTIDLDVDLTYEDVKKIEMLCNEAIWKNIPYEIFYPTPEELAVLEYRSKKELTGEVRIVRVPGYDVCACCGTQVGFSGEIGVLKIASFMHYKKGVRLVMLCGKRAVKDSMFKNEIVNKIANDLSLKAEDVYDGFKKTKSELGDYKFKLSQTRKELFTLKAKNVSPMETVIIENELSRDEIRVYASEIAKVYGTGIVLSQDGENTNYAVSVDKKYTGAKKFDDSRIINKYLIDNFGGRGGGNFDLCQGSVKGEAEVICEGIKEML